VARYLLSQKSQNNRSYEDIQVLNPLEQSPEEFGNEGTVMAID
jgi:hypothetical protein